MRIGRTLPPAAAPLGWKDLLSGLLGLMRPDVEKERFTAELQDYFDRQHCYLLSNGKAALTITLLALKRLHPEKDLVLIPAFTCYSVPSAITRARLKVKLCDVAFGSFDFDEEQLKLCLDDPRLLCVVPTHLFGSVADIPRLRRLMHGRPIPIIEDAAQSMGATWQGTQVGSQGDVCLFSLGRGKVFSTVEGGILLTDNSEIAAAIEQEMASFKGYTRLQLFRMVFVALALRILTAPTLFWIPKALPFLRLGETIYDPDFTLLKMSGFQTGMSKGWQERIVKFKTQRRSNAECWAALTTNSSIRPYLTSKVLPDLIRFPVECGDVLERQAILLESERCGLGLAPVYPDAINGIAELKSDFVGEAFPVAQQLARNLVTLPVTPLLTERDLRKISEIFGLHGADSVTTTVRHAGRFG